MMTDQNTYNRQLIEEFRADRGKSGGPMAGRPLLLLTTTGAKSGQLRTTPMMYICVGDPLLAIASNAGGPTPPAWHRHLVGPPQSTVQIGEDIFQTIAVGT